MGLLDHLWAFYAEPVEKPKPVISTTTAVLLSVFCTLAYVVPLYISRSTRPSATVSRDAPSVIKSRVRTVTVSTFLCSAGLYLFMVNKANFSHSESLRLLGWWPIGLPEIAKSVLLTALLFMGPLFEKGIAEGEWRSWVRGSEIIECLRGWIGWRNYVAGPVTEEITFRSLIVPLHLMAQVSQTRIVFTAPLYFGIAHVPHLYEFKLTHPNTPWAAALLRTLVQFSYTTIFGWLATFLYLRTGSLPAVILVHSFCNYCGLPRLWGRVGENLPVESTALRGKEDDVDTPSFQPMYRSLGFGWTIAYYVILVAGVVAFYFLLWPLTQSPNELASFTTGSG
ncbi:hypothetical protein VTO42DRAFT_2183 [Malbranchea cinnamomea]